jgi:Tol biopolymer transport system component
MALTSGTRLGPYEVLSVLGAGGMGEVYKARDTRLDRVVAVKVLSAQFAADPQFRERFEREARAVSALDHPNICALYDVGEAPAISDQPPATIRFLVMQYLDGETLADRLKKGALPLNQALRFAIEIADALDKAHRVGIVHRDLKPGNIMLTKAGTKLLDFGLAKTVTPAGGGAGLSMLPTTPPGLTAQGTIIGTFQYMAPEQLEGEEADARTDIFAFGAVVYEMVTGKKAFEGKSPASLITAIMGSEPPPMANLQPVTPSLLDHMVRRCLAKDRDDRWQSASDVMRELRWLTEAGSSVSVPAGAVAVHAQRSPKVGYGWIVAAILLLTSLGLGAAMYLRRTPVDQKVYRSTILTSTGLTGPAFARLSLSPDGRRLAYVAPDAGGRVLLWVRQLDGLTAQPLAGTDDATAPFWSPDSRFIGFIAGGKLKKIEASGGPALTLCDAPAPLTGTWNQDDVILFPSGGALNRVPASGGTPTPATALDTKAGEARHVSAWFLPDGRHFLFTAQGSANAVGVYVGSLDSAARTRLLDLNTSVRYADGYLLFLQDGTLMARSFDVNRLTFSGDAMPLAEQINGPRTGAATGVFAVSQTGVLVFQEAGQSGGDARLVWVDRTGTQVAALGDPGQYGDLELSPDGQRLAVSLPDPAQGNQGRDLWIVDVARGLRTRFTFDPSTEISPIWSSDGSRIVYSSNRKGTADLYQKPSNGSGSDEALLTTGDNKVAGSWSADGRFVLFTNLVMGGDLWTMHLIGDKKAIPFLQTRFNEANGRFSPDGRWVAYQSNESGRAEVYVAPFPGPGGKWQVSTGGGILPRWRRDGKELFFAVPTGAMMMTASVNGEGTAFQVGAVQALFQVRSGGPRYFYDVSADGQRFLLNALPEQATAAAAPLTLVVNWTAGLKK